MFFLNVEWRFPEGSASGSAQNLDDSPSTSVHRRNTDKNNLTEEQTSEITQ